MGRSPGAGAHSPGAVVVEEGSHLAAEGGSQTVEGGIHLAVEGGRPPGGTGLWCRRGGGPICFESAMTGSEHQVTQRLFSQSRG